MSGTWSKEDRHSFEKSEVMQELETKILDTVRRADILKEKIAAQDVGEIADAASEAAPKVDALVQSLQKLDQVSSAHDGEEFVDTDEACDEVSDEVAEDGLQDEVIDDLRDLVAAALSEGNIKLAYRIERTIDEIMEQDTPCI